MTFPILQAPGLQPIYEKVAAGRRLPGEDGLTLFRSSDLLGVGYLTQMVGEKLYGQRAY